MVSYEQSDAGGRGPMVVGIGLLLAAALMYVSSSKLFFANRGHQEAQADRVDAQQVALRSLPPEPRLQIDSKGDLKAYLQREGRILSSYGWVDRKNKVVRIPIQRAMELLTND